VLQTNNMKHKKTLIVLTFVIITIAGIITLNYNNIYKTLFLEKWAVENLPNPELKVTIIEKENIKYLLVEGLNCKITSLKSDNELIIDEKSMSKIIDNYKLNHYTTGKSDFGNKYDSEKKLILINKDLINQTFLCFETDFANIEFQRGVRATEIIYDKGKITIKKVDK
jgi:hypothetical protein